MKLYKNETLLAKLLFFIYLAAYVLFPDQIFVINISRSILFFSLSFFNIKKNFQTKYYGFLIWSIFFCSFAFLSIIWALDVQTAYDGSKTLLWNVLLIGSIYYYMQKNVKFVLSILYIIIIIPLCWPIIIILRYSPETLINVRNVMYGASYNRPGIVASLGAVIAYFFFRSYYTGIISIKRKRARHFGCIFVLDVIICLMTTSRKSLMIILVTCVVYEIMCSKNISKTIKKILILSVIISGICFLIFNSSFLYKHVGENLINMFNGILGLGSTDQSTHGRMKRIERGITWFKDRKVLGYGTENYSVLSSIYHKGFNGIADNNYIELLVDFGILGFIIYYFQVIKCLIKNMRQKSKEPMCFLSVLLCIDLLINDFGSSSYKSAVLLLILALCSYFSVNRRTYTL